MQLVVRIDTSIGNIGVVTQLRRLSEKIEQLGIENLFGETPGGAGAYLLVAPGREYAVGSAITEGTAADA